MKLILPGDGHITAFIYILQITSNNNGLAISPFKCSAYAPPLSFRTSPLVIPAKAGISFLVHAPFVKGGHRGF